MSRDVKRTISLYTRLFSLPRPRTMIIFMIIASLVVGGLNELLRTMGIGGPITLIIGALRGMIVVLPSAGLTMLILWWTTRTESILRSHRLIGIITAATFVILVFWFISTLMGWILELLLTLLYGPLIGSGIASLFFIRGFILGAVFALAIIYLIVLSMTRKGSIKGALLSMIFPTFSISCFILMEPTLLLTSTLWSFIGVFLVLSVVLVSCVQILLYRVGRPLKKTFNVDGIQLFRGFLSVWMEGQADQIETCFRQLGRKSKVPLSIICFSDKNQKPQLIFVNPGIHPGPFKNT